MTSYLHLLVYILLLQAASPPKTRREFRWQWRDTDYLVKARTLKNANVGEADRLALVSAIEEQIRPDMSVVGIDSEGQLGQAALNTKIQLVDLTNGRIDPEVVVRVDEEGGFCGASGNCPLWFFRKMHGGYKLLLHGVGQGFTIQPTETNGFKDLVIAMHFSAFEKNLQVYRYARGRYRRVACYDAIFATDAGNRELKHPQVRPSACN